jgi:prepilin-type N-terminal cleavage/methylation domain-containing protein
MRKACPPKPDLSHEVRRRQTKVEERRQGFTLIEFLVVFLIIGILLSWGTLQFSGITARIKLSAATRVIVADLRAGQVKAPSILIFTRDSYTIDGRTKKLISGVTIIRPITIKFSQTGSPLPGYFGTIELKCGKLSSSIIVSNLGKVRVE